MSRYIIQPGAPDITNGEPENLLISELFCDTIQGEGVYTGCPAIFLRLAGCPLNCIWCDTKEVWNKSTKVSLSCLIHIFHREGLFEKLEQGVHLVITGGSPLLQQSNLRLFLTELCNWMYPIKPFIEIENEVSYAVTKDNLSLFKFIDCWNCSPKLESSKVEFSKRVNEKALLQLQNNAKELWFKFVIDNEEESWKEIDETFLRTLLVEKDQVILMPEGCTREELSVEKRTKVVDLAIQHNVRYGGRLHIDLYDNRKGV